MCPLNTIILIALLKVIVTAYLKFGTAYRQVLTTSNIEWCLSIRSFKLNPFTKNILAYLKEIAPNVVKQCPYSGTVDVHLFSTKSKYFIFMPAGEYKIIIHISDEIDENIFSASYYVKHE